MAASATRPRLKERYEKEIRPALVERFGYTTPMQAPVIRKITLNMGVGDAKQDSKVIDAATEQLATIAGQRPSVRRARKSIAAFKLREGMPVGVSVTLRGERSYEFLDRLMSVAIPRIRDFRGMNPRSFDGRGNYSIGVREQIIFPEIDYDTIDQTRGLDITITTSARSDAEAFALLEAFGFPFAREEGAPAPGAAAPPAQGASADAGAPAEATEASGANGGAAATDEAGLEPEAEAAAEPEAVEESEPEAEAAAEPDAEAEPEPQAAAEPETEAAPEAEAAADLEPEADAEPESEPEAAAEPEPEPEANAEPEAEATAEAAPADAGQAGEPEPVGEESVDEASASSEQTDDQEQ
jgi:large subunit ribosomal protein L5